MSDCRLRLLNALISDMERLFIGLDVGGTNLRSALVNHNGNILERRR